MFVVAQLKCPGPGPYSTPRAAAPEAAALTLTRPESPDRIFFFWRRRRTVDARPTVKSFRDPLVGSVSDVSGLSVSDASG
jgi:hypothetical protein